MTNFETISGPEFGRMLQGFGINLLVREVAATCGFLTSVLEFETLRQSRDFAILRHQDMLCQLHADHTYSENPLPSLLPENGARGAGAELRVYNIDPDLAEQRANQTDCLILQNSTNKPHGLRECYLLDPDGYCWVPSRRLTDEEVAAVEAGA